MYEIWLMLNIVWELALTVAPWVIGGAVLWVVLMALALARGTRAQWGARLRFAILIGVVVAIAAFLLLPAATDSSMAELGYWVDWAVLAGMALACGGLAWAFAWPLLVLLGKRSSPLEDRLSAA